MRCCVSKFTFMAMVFLVIGVVMPSGARGDHMPAPDLCHAETWQSITPDDITRGLSFLDDINQPICDGDTLLHQAAKWGNIESITVLLDAGADINSMSNFDDMPPIIRSLFWKKQSLAHYLLKKGADLDLETKGGTPIEVILMYANPNELRAFFNHLNDQLYNYKPHHLAAALNNRFYLMTAIILDAGADMNTLAKIHHPLKKFPNTTIEVSMLEYAYLFSPDEKSIGTLFLFKPDLTLTGQTHDEGYLTANKLYHMRPQIVQRSNIVYGEILKKISLDQEIELFCTHYVISRPCIVYPRTPEGSFITDIFAPSVMPTMMVQPFLDDKGVAGFIANRIDEARLKQKESHDNP